MKQDREITKTTQVTGSMGKWVGVERDTKGEVIEVAESNSWYLRKEEGNQLYDSGLPVQDRVQDLPVEGGKQILGRGLLPSDDNNYTELLQGFIGLR